MAMAYKHSASAAALIDGGAEVRETDRSGNSPLHMAAQVGDLELVTKLLGKGADPNARTPKAAPQPARGGGGGGGGRLAAGGSVTPLMTAARARLVPGFDLVSAWLDLDAKIAAADLVLTGEGRFDASSLSGKGPGAIVARARAAGRRVTVLAGAVGDDVDPEDDVHAITPPGTALAEALAHADRFLAAAITRVVARLA